MHNAGSGVSTGVALVETAVLDEGIASHFRVDAVVVVAMGIDIDAPDDGRVAQQQVNGPERAVADLHVLDQHVAAAVELDELRAEVVVALGHLALLDRHVGGSHGVEFLERFHMGRRARVPLLPDLQPRLKLALAGDRDVFAIERVDERRVVEAFHALPARLDGRQIVLRILAEDQHGVFFQVEVHVAREMNRAGEPLARGNDHAPAACVVACGDRFSNGLGVVHLTAGLGAEIGNGDISRGEDGNLDGRHGERRFHGNPLMTDSTALRVNHRGRDQHGQAIPADV